MAPLRPPAVFQQHLSVNMRGDAEVGFNSVQETRASSRFIYAISLIVALQRNLLQYNLFENDPDELELVSIIEYSLSLGLRKYKPRYEMEFIHGSQLQVEGCVSAAALFSSSSSFFSCDLF